MRPQPDYVMNLMFVRDDERTNPKPFDKLFACYADYSSQCDETMPYICTHGLAKGSCTSNPNVWSKSRMCNTFCDTRTKPSGLLYPSYLPVPDRSKFVGKCPSNMGLLCSPTAPYHCISGVENAGCTASKQYFQNSNSCNLFCKSD